MSLSGTSESHGSVFPLVLLSAFLRYAVSDLGFDFPGVIMNGYVSRSEGCLRA